MEIEQVLDQLDELIYITDIESNELLYVNTSLKYRFHLENYKGRKCYELLQGRNSPCPFCTNERLKKEKKMIEWEIHNSVINRHASLKDFMIIYQGRPARIEIAKDITDAADTTEKIKHALEMERMTLSCVKCLHESSDLKTAISFILQKIGEFLNAERAYIFEIQGRKMNNTYEWCNEGIKSQKRFCQNMDTDLWYDLSQDEKGFVINDVEEIRESAPDSYQILKAQGISSLVTSPLIIQEEMKGYIGVDNPDMTKLEHFTMLDTLSYFLSSSLEQMQMNDLLVHASYFDELTEVYNRNKFIEDTEYLTHYKNTSILIIYIDINGLKESNDQYGHEYGDNILKESTLILRELFRKESIYRIGGDEFVVLKTGIDEAQAEEKASKLYHRFMLSEDCSAAIGYVWSKDCEDLEKKIMEADKYMYKDKMNYYRSKPESIRYRSSTDKMLEISKRPVLLQKIFDKRFEVYLQPKVNFTERKVIGAEALIRYRDDHDQLVMPSEFIPVIENAKNIHYIDFYVFYFICGKIKEWLEKGFTVAPVSVNFSRYTLVLPEFISYLEDVWQKFRIPKELIEIEIVENVENVNSEFLISIMKRIREAGYPVSIDDFGVKYANIALFINVDLDTLKLDRSLVADLTTNIKSRWVIGSIVKMCRDLNIQSIVEGVETEEQFEILKELYCDGAQGYLISRPIPATEYEEKFLCKKKKDIL